MDASDNSFTKTKYLGLFLVFFVTWMFYSYPASLNVWWFLDDYNCFDPIFNELGFLKSGLYNGRILLGPALIPILWDSPPVSNGFSIFHRLFQISMHAWMGVLIVSLLRKKIPASGAIACGGLFTIWCFHGQPTMWLSASIYPLGGLLSLLGLRAILKGSGSGDWKLSLLGSLSFTLAMHSSQISATIGVLLWGILLFCEWIEEGRLQWKLEFRRLAWMIFGLFNGFITNFILMKFSGHLRVYDPPWDRRLEFLWKYIEDFVYGFDAYTPAVATGHIFILSIFVVSVITGFFILKKRKFPLFIALFFPLLLGIGALAPLIITGSLFPSFRVFYLLPLILTGALAITFTIGKKERAFKYAGIILAVFTGLAYFVPARQNASDLLTLYQSDVQTLKELQKFADQAGTKRVLFMDWYSAGGWDLNPYNLTVTMGDNLRSILHTDTSTYRVIWYYTDLENVGWWDWAKLKEKYGPLAKALPRDEPIKFVYIPEEDFVLVVPR